MKKSGLINLQYVNTVIREREKDIHKGDCGKILVIAGSKGMAGAAVLCGRAALRAGAGLVTISVPEELYTIMQISLPEATCVQRTLSKSDLQQYDAIAVGPGLGDDAQNEEIVERVLKEYTKTVVLDADGLNTLARCDKAGALAKAKARVVITPHMGEAAGLLKLDRQEAAYLGRERIADELAELAKAVVVLKGAGTIVTSNHGDSYINTTGNPGMATGGSGDVLTGIIAALAGQGLSPLDSAKAGVYIHGMAGDISADTLGEYGMTAMDVAEMTAFAIKQILKKRD